MSANRELWEKGDFTKIAATMRGSGEALVESLGVAEGMAVLDLGCGDGTTALPAAARGADVLGVDIASNLLAAGRARAAAAGLDNVTFQQGDASRLTGIDDGRFGLTLGAFGAMFAPRPYDVAKEMVRVTRPGGRVVMANWIPGDPTLVAQILKIASAYSPPPPDGFVSPMTWGAEDEVISRFGEAGIPAERVGFERATWVFDYDGTPEELAGLFRDYYGPTMNAFAAARAEGREGLLQAELDALFAAQNRSEDGGTEIGATFLLVNVTRSYP
ncbi:MAG TPA: methyltransferase domain-containing protein [Solirubrobacterales bacterium]|nr:methyltransferase domain-containing protein [Solirubrobacterales bacterium]